MTLIALLISLFAGGPLPANVADLPAVVAVVTGDSGGGVTPTDVGGVPGG